MVEIELDGKKVQVAEGSMVMHAADAAGTYTADTAFADGEYGWVRKTTSPL